MPRVKGANSSASAGTRKKHAKRAAGKRGDDDDGPDPGAPGAPGGPNSKASKSKSSRGADGKKLSKAQRKALPKIKQYIPPPKPPAPPIPDPLDGLGLARTLPAELVVVLRRLGKKDDVTRRKGIEDFRDDWVVKLASPPSGAASERVDEDEIEREIKESVVLSAIPVWMHNLASLLQSPFHRTAALQVLTDLVSIPSLRSAIVDTLSLSLMPGSQNRDVLGSWMVAALEEGRRAGGQALRTWESITTFTPPSVSQTSETATTDAPVIDLTPHIDSLAEYITLSILDPPSLHRDIHPPPVSSTPAQSAPSTPKTGGKGGKPRPMPPTAAPVAPPAEEDAEIAEERWARYRVAGLVGLSYLVQKTGSSGSPFPPVSVSALLRNPLLWTAVSSSPTAVTEMPIGSQPPIRRAAYALLASMIEVYPAEVGEEEVLNILAPAVLGSCWREKEAVVWETAGPAVVKLLTKYKQSWQIVIAAHAEQDGGAENGERRSSALSDEHETGDEDHDDGEDEDDDEDDQEGDDDDAEPEASQPTKSSKAPSSTTATSTVPPEYTDFLDFLSIICPSIPHLTYPLIILILSTLPSSLLPLDANPSPSLPLQNLFAHLWSPFDARLLSTHTLPNSQSAFQVFLQTALDCTVFLVNRSYKPISGSGTEIEGQSGSGSASEATAEWLVTAQMGERAWGDGVLGMGGRAGGRYGRRSEDPAAQEKEAVMFDLALAKVASISDDLVKSLMDVIERVTLEACFPPTAAPGGVSAPDVPAPAATSTRSGPASVLSRILTILSLLKTTTSDALVDDAVNSIIRKVFASTTAPETTSNLSPRSASSPSITPERTDALVEILKTHGDLLEPELVASLGKTVQAHLPELSSILALPTTVALLTSLMPWLSKGDGDDVKHAIWRFVDATSPSSGGADDAVDAGKRFGFVQAIMDAEAKEIVADGALDAVVVEAAQAALSGSETAARVVSTAIASPHWLSTDALHTILALVCTSIHDTVDGLFSISSSSSTPVPSPAPTALEILAAFTADRMDEIVQSDIYVQALVSVHHLVALAPRLGMGKEVPRPAQEVWTKVKAMDGEAKAALAAHVASSLRDLLGRMTCIASPSTIIDVALASELTPTVPTAAQVTSTLLPSATQIVAMIDTHATLPPDPILSIIDPLVPATSAAITSDADSTLFDADGRSEAARMAEAVLALLRADRRLVQSIPTLLQIVVSAMVLATDASAVPNPSRGFYGPNPSPEMLVEFVRDAEAAISFSLSAIDEAPVAWHKTVVDSIKAGAAGGHEAGGDWLQGLLVALAGQAERDVDARAFREVLTRHLRQSGAGEAEGEVWLQYAMSCSERNPNLALSIIYAIKHVVLDSKSFAQAQNRLANALTGISARHANTRGIPALRLLIASAPPEDAAAVFIPQQRAIFVMRHVASWLTSEDDEVELDDAIEVYLAGMYTELAPIIQDVQGSHWPSIFDLIEAGLDSSSMNEPETFPLLHRSLVLLKHVRDLCAANKSLREEYWTTETKTTVFKGVLGLFLQCRDAQSVPIQLLHTNVLDLIQDCPEAVMNTAGLSELCDLIRLSTSFAIQRTAYRILSQVIKQTTLALVLEVEASVAETEEEAAAGKTVVVPQQLVDVVEVGRGVDWYTDVKVEAVLAQLLAWMAIMDHFDDASRTLRWAYLDQLNSSRLLEESLLPLLFAMMGVSEVGAWNFPASQYAVDEFYTDLLQPDDLADLTPLASHVFYRALVTIPSSIRGYYESLKDRQLSLSLLAFTARNFSPVIIAHEFSALREPGAMAQLTDEGLSVRIAQGGGATVAVAGGGGAAEAIASYTVDEQPMEIGIRLPAEFPLKGVDVRDLRRVGVPENKWRGWLMGVQQTITSRNGLILEALTVFKKNVALHFEGVVECAICYSIISLTDRTLPTKPCRTCKNRFHASCLFKWFNSSHSSSCPMCRSLF